MRYNPKIGTPCDRSTAQVSIKYPNISQEGNDLKGRQLIKKRPLLINLKSYFLLKEEEAYAMSVTTSHLKSFEEFLAEICFLVKTVTESLKPAICLS